jgi:MFS family permease
MTESVEESSTPYPLMEDGPALVGETPPPSSSAGEQGHLSPEIIDGQANMASTPTSHHPKEAEIDYYGLALVFLAPALGGFLYGYDIGATSFVLAMLRSSRDPDTWWHDFPMVEQGLLVSALSLGALIGSHIVLVYLAKSIGRRKEIRVSAALYIVGAMLNVMSGTIFANTQVGPFGIGIGIVTLVLGRMTYGAGVGFIMHGAPTYMAEMSPSAVRGAIVSAKETVIVFGIVVGMLMGDLMSDYPDNWTGT